MDFVFTLIYYLLNIYTDVHNDLSYEIQQKINFKNLLLLCFESCFNYEPQNYKHLHAELIQIII